MEDTQQTKRRALVRWAIRTTKDTLLAPSPYEHELLLQFVDGTLTIDQVLRLTEAAQPFRAQP